MFWKSGPWLLLRVSCISLIAVTVCTTSNHTGEPQLQHPVLLNGCSYSKRNQPMKKTNLSWRRNMQLQTSYHILAKGTDPHSAANSYKLPQNQPTYCLNNIQRYIKRTIVCCFFWCKALWLVLCSQHIMFQFTELYSYSYFY